MQYHCLYSEQPANSHCVDPNKSFGSKLFCCVILKIPILLINNVVKLIVNLHASLD